MLAGTQITVMDRKSPYFRQIWEIVELVRVRHGRKKAELQYLCRRTVPGIGTVTAFFKLKQVI